MIDIGEAMQADGKIHITAESLVAAITVAAPARRRRGDPPRLEGQPVSITFDPDSALLTICEATYGLASHAVRATGHWLDRVQVSGEPARVGIPRTSTISLMPNGIPSSGPRSNPAASSRMARSAASKAPCRSITTQA